MFLRARVRQISIFRVDRSRGRRDLIIGNAQALETRAIESLGELEQGVIAAPPNLRADATDRRGDVIGARERRTGNDTPPRLVVKLSP